MKNVTK